MCFLFFSLLYFYSIRLVLHVHLSKTPLDSVVKITVQRKPFLFSVVVMNIMYRVFPLHRFSTVPLQTVLPIVITPFNLHCYVQQFRSYDMLRWCNGCNNGCSNGWNNGHDGCSNGCNNGYQLKSKRKEGEEKQIKNTKKSAFAKQ